jgi:dCMP deaminase
MTRPEWNAYYLGLAFCVKERSPDSETKHGCILTDANHNPLSFGYNGFPQGMPDEELPRSRVADETGVSKYDFILHSEENAILNCLIAPRSLPAGSVHAYVTGLPCNHCLKLMRRAGVSHLFLAERQGTVLEDKKTKIVFDTIVRHTGMTVTTIPKKDAAGIGRLNWLKNVVLHLEVAGYID